MTRGSKRDSSLVWLSLIGLVGATTLYYLLQQPDSPPPPPRVVSDLSQAPKPDSGKAYGPRDRPIASDGSAAANSASVRVYPRPRNAIDRQARLRMLAALSAKLSAAHPAPKGAARTAGHPEAQGSLSKKYIQQAVREIIPLFKECFEMGLAENPNLAGVIKVRFTIIADEAYGGLVEDSQVLDDTALAANPTLNECFRETIYALKIKAPSGGGRVTVTYPFLLSQSGSKGDKDR